MKLFSRKNKTHHAALRSLHADSPAMRWGRRVLIVTLVLLLGWGLVALSIHIKHKWNSQCTVPEVTRGISVSATEHIPAEIAREWFGLTNGCNIAEIDFDVRRQEVMRKHPIVRNLQVTVHLPNKVHINIEERVPVARINLREMKVHHGNEIRELVRWDVVDSEGVFFEFARKDSEKLPAIREPIPSARLGEQLTGRALTALRLIELSSLRGVTASPLPEVSTENNTYLKITTQDYNTLLIAWRIIDDPANPEQPALTRILTNFQLLMNQNLYTGNRTFIVEEPSRIYVL